MDRRIHPACRLPFEHYVWFLLVQPNSDSIQLDLEQPALFFTFGSV